MIRLFFFMSWLLCMGSLMIVFDMFGVMLMILVCMCLLCVYGLFM